MLNDYRKAFYFDGVSSKDFGLYISGDKTFNSPEKNIEKVSVPGRNGDLIISDGTFKNVHYSYQAFLYDYEKLSEKVANLKSFLLTRTGYCRLEDDYHPEEFKMASFTGPIEFEVFLLTAGQATFNFDCKPQRFLKKGEQSKTITANTTLMNPTYCAAKPLITVTGTGSFTISGRTVTVSESGVTIDCESEQAFKGTTYKNDQITVANNLFPVLAPGANSITLSGVTIEITPRWYVL